MSQLSKPEVSGVAAATAMFIEVLVVGIGALAGLFGCIAAIIGYADMQRVAPILSSSPVSGFALAAAYALGIAVDRAADYLLTWPRRRLRVRYFSTSSAHNEARKAILDTPHLVAMSDYARSRMRICRGWFLNCVLLVVAASLTIWRFPVSGRPSLFFVAIVGGSLCAVGFYLTWRSITATGYRKLSQQAADATARVPAQGSEAAAST